MNIEEMVWFKLCYVEGHKAYFTTQDLDKQWGDDWDDAPYEHNAEAPYAPYPPRDCHPDGTPKWRIACVFFDGDFTAPCDPHRNSPYCVRDINQGKVPWLFKDGVVIPAGTKMNEFVSLIKNGGGQVYLPVSDNLLKELESAR